MKQCLLLSVGEDRQNSLVLIMAIKSWDRLIDSVIYLANNFKHLCCSQPSSRLWGGSSEQDNTVPTLSALPF